MITLSKKLREARERKESGIISSSSSTKRLLIRDQLLTKEISELQNNVGSSEIYFPDPNKLYEFEVSVKPEDGMWKGGVFLFKVNVPEEYNIKPPHVQCLTNLWHPNITPEGSVCLSILREHSLDGSGWAPTRSIKDVVWGLGSIFTDLVDFDDPLNAEAARQYMEHPQRFQRTVTSYIFKYATSS